MADLADAIESYISSFMEDVHTAIPGKIVSYEGHVTRRAVVVPTVRQWLSCGPVVEHKNISDVPVVFPSTVNGGFFFEISEGDMVLLLFSEVGIGQYLEGVGDTKDADGVTRMSSTDCIAIPGLFPFAARHQIRPPNKGTHIFHKNTRVSLTDSGIDMKDSHGNTLLSSPSGILLNGVLDISRG